MRRAIPCLALLAIATLHLATEATPRPTASAECPTVTIDCPGGIASLTEPLTFTAYVADNNPNTPLSFNWIIEAGTIVSGQGTPTITVDQAELAGQTVTVKVEVARKTADPISSCYQTATCSRQVSACAMTHRVFDMYEDISFKDEKERLDNFGIQLQNEPNMQGVIIVYGGLNARRGDAEARGNRAKDYLTNKHHITAERILIVAGGNVERSSVELWIGSPGEHHPTAIRTDAVEPLEP